MSVEWTRVGYDQTVKRGWRLCGVPWLNAAEQRTQVGATH
jgi:hypothetical protein